ncbi:uncharacterized protein LOC143529806 [Bidens hawaiensis]|uniref:uncharacterized protein LOC143529806 n=1 Tax=Bidens hawaiensis TaxID=980011 RepID=UPI004049AF6D
MRYYIIDIAQYNIDNGSCVFGISKLTDDVDIIFELEKKANNFETGSSKDLTMGLDIIQSQEIANLKAGVESMNDNVTPIATNVNDKSIGNTHVVEAATFKRKSKNPDFKKNLLGSYDVEMIGELSTSKPPSDGKPVLLTPKIEKMLSLKS